MNASSVSQSALTIERVLEAAGDTLLVMFDFNRAGWEKQIQALKEYWWAWSERHSIQRVCFLAPDDVGGLPRLSLKNGNYVVYGLFDPKPNHLVFSALNETPFALSEEEQKCLVEGEMGDIGFSGVGHNPLGDGHIVAFCAPSPTVLADMKRCLKLNHTFIVTLEDQVINGGNLDDNFAPLVFSAADAQVDADFFFATLERVHPFPLRHIAGQDYLDLKKSIRCRLQRLEASSGHISHPDLSGILAEAAACLKDGHTEIMPVVPIIEAANPDVLMFPFRLKRRFDDLAVKDTIPGLEDLTGKSLVSVDDRPIKEFLQPALCRISGESDTHRFVQFLDNQRLYGAWCALFAESHVTMRFLEKHETSTRRIDLTSLREYDELLPEGEESEGFHHFYRDDNTCYFNCESFVDTDVRRTYMAELFSELRAKKSQRLIIDIRQNGGGNPDLVVFLLEFLTEKPFKLWSRVDIKISDLLIEQHSDYSRYGDLAGLILSESDDPVKPQRREDLFKGDLYVLIGPCTFSAAAEFAAVVKDHGLGQLVGEETGGRRQSTGDALTGLLPLSGIRFRVSAMLYYAATPEAGDETRGTLPDISPKAEELSEYEETADPLLQYTLDHLV